jgi:hypothetical protein
LNEFPESILDNSARPAGRQTVCRSDVAARAIGGMPAAAIRIAFARA